MPASVNTESALAGQRVAIAAVVYFSVVSTDDAVVKAEGLGGTVVQAAEDTPYGRMAVIADPTGALFSLHQAPAESDS